MAKMKKCKHCGAQIAKSAKICPNCGGKNKKPLFLRPWFLILVLIILVGLGGGMSSSDSDKAKPASGVRQIGTVAEQSANASSAQETDAPEAKKEAAEPAPEEASEASDKAAPDEGTATEEKEIFQVGDILQDGDIEIVYMASGDYAEDNSFLEPKEGYRYIFLEFAFINHGKRDNSVSFYDFDAFADGYAVDMYYGGEGDISGTLSAGRQTSGKVYFTVPVDAKQIEVEYTPNVFSSRKIKFLYEGNKNSGYTLSADATRREDALQVGDVYEDKSLRITYLSCSDYISDNSFIQPSPGNHYVVLEVEFENLSSSDRFVSSYSFDCYADGAACKQEHFADSSLSATISPGRKTKGTVTFEIPDHASVVEAEFESNVWTSKRITFTIQ